MDIYKRIERVEKLLIMAIEHAPELKDIKEDQNGQFGVLYHELLADHHARKENK